MEIDKIKVQKLIDKTIGSEYEINEVSDTSKYVFISWKHKEYDIDDERGHQIGVGPVAFNKITKEYKLLGSGDMLDDEYHKYLFENVETNEQEFEVPKKEEIKNSILRRKFVNDNEIHLLGNILEKEFGDINFHTEVSKSIDMDWTYQRLIVIESTKAMKSFIDFWTKIDFKYEYISESKILIWKLKTSA